MGELTAEAVVDRQVPATPRVSPDGRWVVYATAPEGRTGRHPVSGLWLAPADGGEPPREFAPSPAEDREPRWSADSGWICFLSDRAERGTAQLYRARREGGTPERLTDWRAAISDYALLPDGDAVVLVAPRERDEAADPRVRVVGRAAGSAEAPAGGLGQGSLEPPSAGPEAGSPEAPAEPTPPLHPTWDTQARPDRLWLLDLPTRAVRPLGDFGSRHVVEAVARPDGGALAVLTWSAADREPGVFEPALHLFDPRTGARQELGVPALEASSLTWWRDETGWRLAYLGLTPPGLIGGDAVFDAGDHRNLTAGLPVCPLELAGGGPLLALFAEGLDTTIRRLDPATGAFAELTRAAGSLNGLSAGGGTVAVVASTATEPDTVHCGPPGGPLARLGELPLRGIRWGGQERLAYRAEDGLDLDGLLVLPPGRTRADGPFPLVTLVHGGPYDRFADRFQLGWFRCGQWLAAGGFAVFLPNPRGSSGHGHAFAASVAGDVGGAEFTDLLTGIDLLVKDGVADEDRLGIAGGSHGGFMAAWAVAHTDRFKAAVVSAGVIDWPLLAATGEHSRFELALGSRETSPITHADRIATPVLIVHGEDDANVPLSQAELLHHALGDRPHEFVVYPREGHSLRERGHQLDFLRRMRAWFSHLLA
ncbi:prolyl oligopeptidase family serine peptidase [Amycolatopsis vancoresmycina]|uniref:Peptidase S9 prolyl oligopeptidase active site domain protein n=1 Tax=Amycolatopsis vancoresmycina DSM 44592 TaxID=1292037 RepID=R1HWQ3_9PSEU|nr:prolyl oligopeptidase family serine peptidase [Amycolatopsis vancoresmycina]EOD64781.1 peptidase S9 prolyl oligopeptidase active site domain protein [Amycolatopsis vancoresmycina DSM 44592]